MMTARVRSINKISNQENKTQFLYNKNAKVKGL